MTSTLFVPMPPGAVWLSMNDRMHRAPWSRNVKAWRTAAAACGALIPDRYTEPVDVLAEIHKAPGRNVRWDSHNLAPTTKAVIDGLVDAGVLSDDNTSCVYWVATVDGGRREDPGVTVTITPTRARSSSV